MQSHGRGSGPSRVSGPTRHGGHGAGEDLSSQCPPATGSNASNHHTAHGEAHDTEGGVHNGSGADALFVLTESVPYANFDLLGNGSLQPKGFPKSMTQKVDESKQ
jgi:hypothetical protein